MRLPSLLAAGALALCSATPALADITVLEGPFAGPLDPVSLDEGALDFVVSGVVGPANTGVTFTGAENLVVQGQSIEAAAGSFNFLLFTLTDPLTAFTTAEFNLDSLADGAVSIFAYDQFGAEFGGGFTVDSAGANFFNVSATNGQTISSIVVMSAAALDSVGQIRLGGIVGVIPEPASWAMMIVGFGGVGGALRARRRLVVA